MARFHQAQNELGDHFLKLAAATGKPRGLRWKKLDFVDCWKLIHDIPGPNSPSLNTANANPSGKSDAVSYLTLIHSVNLHFEAIEGSDMEDVAAVSTIRDGCAIFHYREGRWGTGGRVLLNLAPDTAAQAAFPDASVVAESKPL